MKDAYAIMRKTELYVVISKVAFIQNDALDEPNYFPELEILKLCHLRGSNHVPKGPEAASKAQIAKWSIM